MVCQPFVREERSRSPMRSQANRLKEAQKRSIEGGQASDGRQGSGGAHLPMHLVDKIFTYLELRPYYDPDEWHWLNSESIREGIGVDDSEDDTDDDEL